MLLTKTNRPVIVEEFMHFLHEIEEWEQDVAIFKIWLFCSVHSPYDFRFLVLFNSSPHFWGFIWKKHPSSSTRSPPANWSLGNSIAFNQLGMIFLTLLSPDKLLSSTLDHLAQECWKKFQGKVTGKIPSPLFSNSTWGSSDMSRTSILILENLPHEMQLTTLRTWWWGFKSYPSR